MVCPIRVFQGLLAPCEGGFPTQHVNGENVETYAIWPYELFGVNRTTEAKWPLAVAKASFQAVHFGHGNTAWRYDGQVRHLSARSPRCWASSNPAARGHGSAEGGGGRCDIVTPDHA